jgi:hypothetical protein
MKKLAALVCLAAVLLALSGAGQPLNADTGAGKVWAIKETLLLPEGGRKVMDTPTRGRATYEASATSLVHSLDEPGTPASTGLWGMTSAASPPYGYTHRWLFNRLPDTLTPGNPVTITITGQFVTSGAYTGPPKSVLTLEVSLYNTRTSQQKYSFWQDSGDESRLMEVTAGAGPVTRAFTFIAPADVTDTNQLMITLKSGNTMVRRIYQAAGGAGGEGLTVEHFPPFDHFKAGTGANISLAGDVAATLKDKDGKPVKDALVAFYVEPEPLARNEPGRNLYEVFDVMPLLENKPPVRIKDETPGRKYLGWARTGADGGARINYLKSIGPRQFADALLTQRANFNDEGRVSGNIWSGVWDQKTETIIQRASAAVDIRAMARLLAITGEGRSDTTEKGKKYPGRVRVKRLISFPKFDFTPVEEGFFLMPGDIVDIDGNAAVEIAWVNGNRITARVPDKIQVGTIREPWEPEEAQIYMLSSAYDSGFQTKGSRAMARTFGFGSKKGIEFLVESIPYVGKLIKEGTEFVVEMHEEFKDLDLSETDIVTRIRIRSRVIIDNTGDGLKIYNLEGSPGIRTAAGGEMELAVGKMVAVSDKGNIGEARSFDTGQTEKEFLARGPAITRSQSSAAGGFAFNPLLAVCGGCLVR